MNVIQEIKRINERELEQGVSGKASWHYEYKDSAWVFAGGFSYDLTEGDILCVMSQWGEIEDINLCREKDTGKSKVMGEVSSINQLTVARKNRERKTGCITLCTSCLLLWQAQAVGTAVVGCGAFRLHSDTAAALRLCECCLADCMLPLTKAATPRDTLRQ